jgi:hypothetical protein
VQTLGRTLLTLGPGESKNEYVLDGTRAVDYAAESIGSQWQTVGLECIGNIGAYSSYTVYRARIGILGNTKNTA